MSETSEIRNWYLSLFRDFENRLNGEKSKPIHKVRRAAIDKFAELDFPNLHQEDWRFTDISPILKHTFSYAAANEGPLPSQKEISRFLFGGMRAYTMVFVNGFYSAALSKPLPLPGGVVIASLAEAMKRDEGQISVNIAKYLDPGRCLHRAQHRLHSRWGVHQRS